MRANTQHINNTNRRSVHEQFGLPYFLHIKMPPQLYYVKMSPPVRSVLLTAKALGLDLDLIPVDVVRKENQSQGFLELNPLGKIPTLNDDGFILFDSHAICGYLVNKYAKTDAFYPREASARATVDQRLHFDSGVLFPKMKSLAFPILHKGLKSFSESQKESVYEVYEQLDKLLGDSLWIAGPQMTIADFCCVSTISSLDHVFVPGVSRYPRLAAWYERCQTSMEHYQEINQAGVELLKDYFKSKL